LASCSRVMARSSPEAHRLDGGSMERSAAMGGRAGRAARRHLPRRPRDRTARSPHGFPPERQHRPHRRALRPAHHDLLSSPVRPRAGRRAAADRRRLLRERSLEARPTDIDATVFPPDRVGEPLAGDAGRQQLVPARHARARAGADGFRLYRDRLPAAQRAGLMPHAPRRDNSPTRCLEEVPRGLPPTAGKARDYAGYVMAAWAEPLNRARADRVHVSWPANSQLLGNLAGRPWVHERRVVRRPVMSAFRGAWRDGRWRVGLVFMDHDDMHLAEPTAHGFVPEAGQSAARCGTSRTPRTPRRADPPRPRSWTIFDQFIDPTRRPPAGRIGPAPRLGGPIAGSASPLGSRSRPGRAFLAELRPRLSRLGPRRALYLAHLDEVGGRGLRPDAQKALEHGGIASPDCDPWLD